MFENRRRTRAAARITPGTGRALKPFRWWQMLSRSLFSLTLDSPVPGCPQRVHTIDVPYWQRIATEDGQGKAHLYVDGRHQAVSTFPAVFPVEGGVIEVRPSTFGLRRCHYVPEEGPERQLLPDRDSAEGRRARLDREHPGRSRLLGLLSLLVILTAALLGIPQIVELAAGIPPITERFGAFTSPIDLPWWGNLLIGLVAATASTERATRLRYSWLDSLAQ